MLTDVGEGASATLVLTSAEELSPKKKHLLTMKIDEADAAFHHHRDLLPRTLEKVKKRGQRGTFPRRRKTSRR